MDFLASLSVNIATYSMFLHVFFLSGALADCPEQAVLFITAPRKMEALSGSCLQIPCNFTAKTGKSEFDASRETFGVWIKTDSNHNNVIFNSGRTNNIYPMNITGNLSQKNCTTLFSSLLTNYTDKYFFRIENGPYRATASCDPLQIQVTDPHNNVEENTNGTFTTKIQQTITLSDRHDGKNITCSARYTVNEGEDVKTAEETKTLSVSYAPKNTSVSISPSGLVSAGSWVNLTCSSRAKPPVRRFTWFKNSKDGAMTVSEGQLYSFNVTDGGVYYCVATNDLGNQTSANFNIKDRPDGPVQWEAVVGGIIGFIILICLVVCVCALVCCKRSNTTDDSTQQQSQSSTGVELFVEKSARNTEEGEKDLHYGEIDFSKRRPEPTYDSVGESGQQQDTVYAQVKVSQTANSFTPAAEGQEDLYAQVKK